MLLTWNLTTLKYFDWNYFEATKPKVKEKLRNGKGGMKSLNLTQTFFNFHAGLS